MERSLGESSPPMGNPLAPLRAPGSKTGCYHQLTFSFPFYALLSKKLLPWQALPAPIQKTWPSLALPMEETLSFILPKFWEKAQEHLLTPLAARDRCQERQGKEFLSK